MQKRWNDFSALAAASSMKKTRYLSMPTTNFAPFCAANHHRLHRVLGAI